MSESTAQAGIELDLTGDVCSLTAALVDLPSVSGAEKALADAIEGALRTLPRLSVERYGQNVVARTDLGRGQRVILAGHIDTVPIADNVPSRVEGDTLYGCGSSDMKSGVAVQLRIAAALGAERAPEPTRDVTFVFYDCEEVESARNGLARMAAARPEWLHGDFAVLLEPTDGAIEGGCQGTLRAKITVPGVRAHSARSWLGRNAIHAAAPLLGRLAAYTPRQVEVEGLTFREGLNAVGIDGGVAGNVIPDECTLLVNYRFAPDLTEARAADHVRELFPEFAVEIVDSAPAARPGLDLPAAADFAARLSQPARAKLGWTDVARFAALGVPAVNFGPGDPNLAHTRDEHVDLAKVRAAEAVMLDWLALR